jgi:hypothetical protein
MRPLSSSDLLHIWERGTSRKLIEQALIILDTVFPQAPGDLLVKLNVGQRDLCLLLLRALTFGSRLNGLAECPACHQCLELDFDLYDMPILNSPLPKLETLMALKTETSFRKNDYDIAFRLPNSADLAGLAGTTDIASGCQQLLEACVMSVKDGDTILSANELPADILNDIVEHMSQADPLADLTLSAICPSCNHSWEIMFDIVSFFWGEIHAWSSRLVREVHSLAIAYGWREADILAMSAWRRQHYMQLIGT